LGYSTSGQWTASGTGLFTPDANTLTAVYHLSASDKIAGNVQLVLTSIKNGVCSAVTDSIMVMIEPVPTAAFTFSVAADESFDFIDQSVGAAAWHWQFGAGGGTSTQQNANYLFTASGTYSVTLIITSIGGCKDTALATVTTTDVVEKPIDVPSGYTPNKDGLNDKVRPLGGPFTEMEFKIFNEWGNELYSSTDQNDGWDGTYMGKVQPEGVYMYTLKGVTKKGRAFAKSGSITLLR
jgi:gliding motility-associated-like protein